MSFPLTADSEMIVACDNCGSEDHMFSNSSGDMWCESCGWSEADE
jgi:ribosomal protein S27E